MKIREEGGGGGERGRWPLLEPQIVKKCSFSHLSI